jgi:signal transduction histidine kinase/DNA-binding response OmpR family regulator/CHASE3 domain sensor protein
MVFMKIFSIERKVALLIFFMVLIVGAAGYVTYQSLTYILSAIKKEAQPNLTLVLLKEVNANLVKGESNLKYYSLTGQEKYLKYYREQLILLDKKIDQLNWYNQGNTLRKSQIDTLHGLINEKSLVWNKMLLIRSSNRVGEALNRLEEKLDSVTDTITMKVPTSVKIVRADSSKNKQLNIDDKSEADDNFFSRLFKRKSEVEKKLVNSEPVVMDLLDETIAEKDTSFGVGIDKNLLQEQISQIRQSEGDTLRKLNAREISLVKRNEFLTQRINLLILRMERQELNSIGAKAVEADKLVEKTNKWIIVFLTGFAFLVMVVFLVIARYVRKTNAIQEMLIKSKDEALKLSRAKEVFMANMSHEIRTPMNAIVGFSEQVLQTPHDFQTKEQLSIIKKSADHLLKIINDILDLSKLEAGKLTIESEAFQLQAIVDDVVQLYKPSCESKGLSFECNIAELISDVLIGDAFRLKQILFNLVGNAVKFTSEGNIILQIESSALSKSTVSLKIKIIDSGIGIAADQLDIIFEEFKQADTSTTRRYGGTGLGLSIVKRLIELQNGKLSVKSEPGKGSEFTFSIPFKIGKKEDLKISEVKILNTNSLKNISFLVADDDEYNRKLMAHILNKWKVKYTLVNNGKELLEEFNRNPTDIILLDIRMPEIDGIEATQLIRNSSANEQRQIPIIALTATIAKEDIKRCRDAGIESIIQKPFSEEILLANILQVLKIENDLSVTLSENNQENMNDKGNKIVYDNLYHLANNDENFVVEMLEMFIKTSNEGLENIDKALIENNLLAVAENAHKIKSPCKHLGATETANLLKEIELKSRNNATIQEISTMVDKAREDIHLLIADVEEYLSKANSR